jgi:hypothetical protein
MVPIAFKLILQRLLYLLLVIFIQQSFFKLVAPVIAASAAVVFRPRAQTHPTEMVVAVKTSHMIATVVLFDRSLALRARLRVGQHPRFEVVPFLLKLAPQLYQVAVARVMRDAATKQARFSATLAHDCLLLG